METDKTKDIAATVIGGGTGVDLFWTGLDGIMNAIRAGQHVEVNDCKLLVYGIIAAYLGFMAWRRQSTVQQTTTTIVHEETKTP